jgi:hypothetical protein
MYDMCSVVNTLLHIHQFVQFLEARMLHVEKILQIRHFDLYFVIKQHLCAELYILTTLLNMMRLHLHQKNTRRETGQQKSQGLHKNTDAV